MYCLKEKRKSKLLALNISTQIKRKKCARLTENRLFFAGAVNTPAILQRSGYGDAALLKSLGIDVVVNNPNVGANISDQYGAISIMTGSTVNPYLQGFINGAPYLPNDQVRRLQTIGLNLPNGTIMFFGFILHPKSVGSVQIVSRNPFIYPNLNLNFYSDGPVTDPNSDAYAIVSFFKIMKNIASASGNTLLFPPAADFESDEALLADAQSVLQSAYHNVGSTRMGTSIANGVVDGNLRVFGVKNLMIADIGVLPTPPSGNTCYSAYLVGLEAAAILDVPTPPAL